MASCSAWLFELLLSSFSFIYASISFPIKTATPDLNTALIFTSVNVCLYLCFLVVFDYCYFNGVSRVWPILEFHMVVEYECLASFPFPDIV